MGGYPEATHDITSTELQFQHWNRIIMQSELLHRPPRPPRIIVAAESQGPVATPEEVFLEHGIIDWSTDGVPVSCQNVGKSGLSSWMSRLQACFLGLYPT